MPVAWRRRWASAASSSRRWRGLAPPSDFLTAPIAFDFTRSYVARLDALDLSEVNSILADLEREGTRIVEAAGVSAADISVRLNIDMRYVGQGYEVRVPFAKETLTARHIAEMQRAFEGRIPRLLRAIGARRAHRGGQLARPHQRSAAECGQRRLWRINLRRRQSRTPVDPVRFTAEGATVDTPVFRRDRLGSSWSAAGPCIIEEAAATTVVHPGWTAQTAAGNCLLLTREDDK